MYISGKVGVYKGGISSVFFYFLSHFHHKNESFRQENVIRQRGSINGSETTIATFTNGVIQGQI
jgi:hypothetical protein